MNEMNNQSKSNNKNNPVFNKNREKLKGVLLAGALVGSLAFPPLAPIAISLYAADKLRQVSTKVFRLGKSLGKSLGKKGPSMGKLM